MEIVKVTTYSRDSKDNVGGKQEIFFADPAKALEFAKSCGRNNGGDTLECRHFWSDESDNVFASFTDDAGDKITNHAEISFHELI